MIQIKLYRLTYCKKKGHWMAEDGRRAAKFCRRPGHFDNPWLLFSKYIDAVNDKCTQTVLPKWESILGGAVVSMSTHCFSMSEAERVDPTLQVLTQNSTFIYK